MTFAISPPPPFHSPVGDVEQRARLHPTLRHYDLMNARASIRSSTGKIWHSAAERQMNGLLIQINNDGRCPPR
jgi:hypothetical protein